MLCRQCNREFSLTAEDCRWLARFSVPQPTFCPECRQQRRAAFRNSRRLYRRQCDLSGRPIISVYSPDKPFRVFDTETWWGDSWDPLTYGRAIDFARPFFDQFRELMLEVPRPALFNKASENSVYTNHAVHNKNCFMCFNAGYCEDLIYGGDTAVRCRSSCDIMSCMDCELLVDSVDCENCYSGADLIRCRGCRDSHLLFDCRNCSHCTMCWNLRNAEYCIENVAYPKEEYNRRLRLLELPSAAGYGRARERFASLMIQEAVSPFVRTENAENVRGDHIQHSKGISYGFDVSHCEDLRYAFDSWEIKDSMDVFQTMDRAELQYETHASSVSVDALFCNVSHENHSIRYTDHCFNAHHLFGCIGVRHEEYCILNRQYSRDDYVQLAERLTGHMRETGEWGEFFPAALSPFGYNETVAQDFFPLTREKALGQGFLWQDEEAAPQDVAHVLPSTAVPEVNDAVDEARLQHAFACARTERPFRISKQEWSIRYVVGAPLPRLHPDERFRDRLARRNPRQLWQRQCASCGVEGESTFSPSRPERVYCEACYLSIVQG